MANGFSRGFSDTFGSSLTQSQANSGALAQERLRSKLKREEKEAEFEFENKQITKKTRAAIKAGALDDIGIGQDTLNELSEGRTLEEVENTALRIKERALGTQKQDFEILNDFQSAAKQAQENQFSLAPNKTVQAAAQRQGLSSFQDIQSRRVPSQTDISAEQTQLQRRIQSGSESGRAFLAASQEDRRVSIAEENQKLAQERFEQIELNVNAIAKADSERAQRLFLETINRTTPERTAEAVERLEGFTGAGSKRPAVELFTPEALNPFTGGAIGVALRTGKALLKSAFKLNDLSENDRDFADKAASAIELKGIDGIKDIVPSGKINDNQLVILEILSQGDKGDILKAIGKTDKDVKKTKTGLRKTLFGINF